jgi:hypothetical protein
MDAIKPIVKTAAGAGAAVFQWRAGPRSLQPRQGRGYFAPTGLRNALPPRPTAVPWAKVLRPFGAFEGPARAMFLQQPDLVPLTAVNRRPVDALKGQR